MLAHALATVLVKVYLLYQFPWILELLLALYHLLNLYFFVPQGRRLLPDPQLSRP
jgi:hypothetical protein